MTIPARRCPWCGRAMSGSIDLTDERIGRWWCRRCFRSYWAIRRRPRLGAVLDLRAARSPRPSQAASSGSS